MTVGIAPRRSFLTRFTNSAVRRLKWLLSLLQTVIRPRGTPLEVVDVLTELKIPRVVARHHADYCPVKFHDRAFSIVASLPICARVLTLQLGKLRHGYHLHKVPQIHLRSEVFQPHPKDCQCMPVGLSSLERSKSEA